MIESFLRSISVSGLFGLYDYTIHLDHRVSLVHGMNGCGKSTIMLLTTELINGRYEKLQNTLFSRFCLDFSGDIQIKILKDSTLVQETSEELSEVWEKFHGMEWSPENTEAIQRQQQIVDQVNQKRIQFIRQQKNRVILSKEGRVTAQFEFCCTAPEDQDQVQACREAISALLGKYHALILNASRMYVSDEKGNIVPKIPILVEQLRQEIEDLLAQPRCFVSEEQQNELRDCYMAIPSKQEIPPQRSERDPVYEFYLKVNRFATVLEQFGFPNKYLLFSPDHRLSFWNDASCSIPIASLSTGEKNLFVLVFELVFHCDENTLVMIDEPENSLHVSWQMAFVDHLLQLSDHSGFQALVTTHSPNVINDHWDLTLGLGEDEDGEDEAE